VKDLLIFTACFTVYQSLAKKVFINFSTDLKSASNSAFSGSPYRLKKNNFSTLLPFLETLNLNLPEMAQKRKMHLL
jgi:hypothetical protein